ncbi:hypothetical protein CCACVL1_30571 [Corchorus capsularis]|uniref:Uncharacterized protein n=1 Tax=Corchorus capsularis TaxID=210143 RepID=A0A1R3FWT6_COCAP|nr:hypothetical protein CCACVL1_30571 [Corchorus capsularis]
MVNKNHLAGVLEVYKKTQFLNDESRAVIERAEELLATATAGDVENLDTNELEHRIMTEVLGPERNGRVSCLGFGATPTNVFKERAGLFTSSKGSSSSLIQIEQLRTEMEFDMLVVLPHFCCMFSKGNCKGNKRLPNFKKKDKRSLLAFRSWNNKML